MIKVIVAIPKRPDISESQFHAHWKDPHGTLALNIKAMRRYVQAHRIPYPGLQFPTGPYEGFAEVWLDNLPTALGLGRDPDYQRHLVPDEPNFCDVKRLSFTLTEEDIALPGSTIARADRYFKIMQFVRRSANASPESFRSAWGRHRDEEAIVRSLNVARHVRCYTAPGTEPAPGSGFDAVRELWWTDAALFETARSMAPIAWDQLMNSGIEDSTATLVVPVEELRLLWPGT